MLRLQVFPSFFGSLKHHPLSFDEIEDLQNEAAGYCGESLKRLIGYRVVDEETIELEMAGLV